MKTNFLQSIIILISALAIAASLVYGFTMIDHTYNQQVTNEARYQCAQSSRYTVAQSDNTQVWYPVEEMYLKCLAEKGIN